MQKFGQTVVFLFVFVGVALLFYVVASPHFLPPATAPTAPVLPPTAENASDALPTSSSSPVLPNTPISPPRTTSQREADTIETRRAPYYRWLHTKYGDHLAGQQTNPADSATLDLYTTHADPALVLYLLGQAVQPYANQYGFNHVRFFQPNPPGEVERYRFDAEASPDPDGTWKAFTK